MSDFFLEMGFCKSHAKTKKVTNGLLQVEMVKSKSVSK